MKLFKHTLISLIIFSLIAVSFSPLQAKPAEAITSGLTGSLDLDSDVMAAGLAGCAANAAVLWAMGQIPRSILPVQTDNAEQGFKEGFFDCVFYVLLKALLQSMTASIVNWAQTGFDGNPAFIQNPGKFLGDVARREVDILINQLDSEFGGLLCSPWRRPIVEAIIRANTPSKFEDRLQCTLSDAIANIEGFLDGDFHQGGWRGFISLVHNNPYSDFLAVEIELDRRIAAAIGIEEQKLSWGQGFLSWEGPQQCYTETDYTDDGTPVTFQYCDPPQINTPGSVVEKQINEALGSGRRQLELADEINEMISAVIAYLIQDILTSDKGLAGYNNPYNRETNIIIPEIPEPSSSSSDDTEPGPPGEPYLFERVGVFHVPTPGNETHREVIPVPQNVSYGSVQIELDVTNNGWAEIGEGAGGMHNIFWFFRQNWNSLFGYVHLRGPGGSSPNQVTAVHGIGLPAGNKLRKHGGLGMAIGERHRFNYLYNAAGGSVTLTVTNSQGQVMARLEGPPAPNVRQINTGTRTFEINFGNPLDEFDHEPPTYGWEYANLRIEFLPAATSVPGDPLPPLPQL